MCVLLIPRNGEVWRVYQVIHISWAILNQVYRPKSVRYRCVSEHFGRVFESLIMVLFLILLYRDLCYVAQSNLFLFLLITPAKIF